MLQASLAMGAGLLLFLPTFNALNFSYVENVAPPPWMPTPDEIPDDFEPPDDWTPPDDWEPPEGDWEIPPEWAEKYKGKIPPGGCGSDVAIRRIAEIDRKEYSLPNESPPINGAPWDEALTFTLHDTSVGYAVWVNVTDWRGGTFTVTFIDAAGNESSDSADGRNRPFPPIDTATVRESNFEFTRYGDPRVTPFGGEYTLQMELPTSYSGGKVRVEGMTGLACGGMLAR